MSNFIKLKNKKGFSIVEILAVIAIISIALSSLLGVAVLSLKASGSLKEMNQADMLVQDAMEAIRNFRDGTVWNVNGLGTLPPGVEYHFQTSGSPSSWEAAPGVENFGIFSRKIIFSNVYRDSNRNIVKVGGTNDLDTKLATVTVSWKTKEIKIEAYFTNWKQ